MGWNDADEDNGIVGVVVVAMEEDSDDGLRLT